MKSRDFLSYWAWTVGLPVARLTSIRPLPSRPGVLVLGHRRSLSYLAESTRNGGSDLQMTISQKWLRVRLLALSLKPRRIGGGVP